MVFSSLLLSTTLAAVSTCAPVLDFMRIRTPQGVVLGKQLSKSVAGFLNIPYAQPPIDTLRFEPPQPINPATYEATKVIHATSFGPVCYQYSYRTVMGDNMRPTTPESEDCLNLNIFVPRADKHLETTHKKAVYIWAYGGAFGEGGASVPIYNPTDFAQLLLPDLLKLIVLSYRLNLFGFPNSPALSSQNLGIRDSRLLLEWVRDNIAHFGGDSNRIIMGGESACADIAHAFTYSHAKDPIFKGIVLQSGTVQVITAASENVDAEFVRVATAVGCADANDRKKELECMKKVDATKLRAAISSDKVNYFGTLQGGNPMVDNVTLFSNEEYLRRGKAGDFARVPTLMGNMNNEGDSVLNFSEKKGVNRTNSDLITLSLFNCNLALESGFRALHNVPVWRYRYMGVWPSVTFFDWLRAYHTADIPFFTGAYRDLQSNKTPTEAESKGAALFQGAIAAFVRDPAKGLEKVGWPKFNPKSKSLVELFNDNEPEANFVDPDIYDGACANAPPVPWLEVPKVPED